MPSMEPTGRSEMKEGATLATTRRPLRMTSRISSIWLATKSPRCGQVTTHSPQRMHSAWMIAAWPSL